MSGIPAITLQTPGPEQAISPPSGHVPIETSPPTQVAKTKNARNLVVCIDGTSCKFSEKNTNVVELYNRLEKSNSQLTYYNSGVGTYAKPSWRFYTYFKNVVSKTMDMAIAWSFEEVIIGAYRWLADNYRPEDRIFLFGFSRGAYQIRALAAMIETVGLMYAGNVEQIPFAWELYASNQRGQAVKTFKETFSRPGVDLHFLGAWDTVSSIGIFLHNILPITDQCGHITHFRHALALDERRARFLPEYVIDSPKEGGTKKEVWFAGTHADIGGGNKLNLGLDLGPQPLRWMMQEARAQSLSVREHEAKTGIPNADVTESLEWVWRIFEYLPISRRSYDMRGKSSIAWLPHWGRGRKVLPGQYIHWTVRAGLNQEDDPASNSARQRYNYRPKASVRQEDNSRLEWAKSIIDICIPEIDPQDTFQQNPIMPVGAVGWEGGQTLLTAIDLVNKWRNSSGSDDWLGELYKYTTRDGKPELIWHYGGPELLHDLVLKHDTPEVEKIIRSVIGLHSSELGTEAISISGYTWDSIPAFVLLQEWVATDPSPGSPTPNTSDLLSKFLLPFKPKPNGSAEPPDEKARWDLKYVPQASRSTKLVIIATDVVLATLKREDFRSRFSKDPEKVRVVLSLTSLVTADGAPSETMDVARKALSIIGNLDPGQLFSNHRDRWNEITQKIMSLLTVVDHGGVIPTFQALTTLAHDQQCAGIIVGHGGFPSLLTQFLKHTSPQVVIITCGLLGKLLDRGIQLNNKLSLTVSSELVSVLDSNQYEVVRAALDIAKILASRSMNVKQAFINKLISFKGEDHHRNIVLAILGWINLRPLPQDTGKPIISSYVRMMNDYDRWLARGAIRGLNTQLADRNDSYLTLMCTEGAIQQLARLFKLALSLDRQDLSEDMKGVITLALRLAEGLSRSGEARTNMIQLGVIKYIYRLSDSNTPRSLTPEAGNILRDMRRNYGDVQSVLREYERKHLTVVVGDVWESIKGLRLSPVSAAPRLEPAAYNAKPAAYTASRKLQSPPLILREPPSGSETSGETPGLDEYPRLSRVRTT